MKITKAELIARGSQTATVKNDSPRGVETVSVEDVRVGDFVVINNEFVEVVEDTHEEPTQAEKVRAELEDRRDRSAWDKGVTAYALDILDTIEERSQDEGHEPKTREELKDFALNGAREWSKPRDLFAAWSVASWGGSYLIYDGDIARRLCCPSELRKTRDGERRPNAREEWLDVQARALFQAFNRLSRLWSFGGAAC